MNPSESTADLVEQIRDEALFSVGSALEGTEGIETMAEFLRDNAHPEFVTVMVAMSAAPTEYPGVAGFKEALSDWISPYERFRLEIEEVIQRENKLVFLARQVGTTKHDGVEVETASATVWSLVDGQIRQATFYLDRRAGLIAAGIDPDSR